MGVEEKESFQESTEQEGIWGEDAGQGRGQGNPLELYPATGKKPMYFPLFYALDIFIPGIVAVIVIPQDKAPGFYNPEHLTGHRLFHGGIQNGSEDRGLQHQIKGAGEKGQMGGVGSHQPHFGSQD